MRLQEIHSLREAVSLEAPLIHCITNPISLTQCANLILAVGARPIMAEHPLEVEEITKTARSLLLNLGNITDARIRSMEIAAKTAMKKEIPVVLDLVGIACSSLRKKFAEKLLKEASFTLLKGNYSEILAMQEEYTSSGVDADVTVTVERVKKASVKLARKYDCMVLASGKVDLVTDGERVFYVKNGTSQMGRITGTGCMLGAIAASYLSVSRDISAVVSACSVFGICGELSVTEKGNGTFFVNLMDHLSAITEDEIEQYGNWEEINDEET